MVLELFRILCTTVLAMLVYQLFLLIANSGGRLNAQERSVFLTCVFCALYNATVLISTVPEQLRGVGPFEWAVAPFFGVTTFVFYTKMMENHLSMRLPFRRPLSLLPLPLLLVSGACLLDYYVLKTGVLFEVLPESIPGLPSIVGNTPVLPPTWLSLVYAMVSLYTVVYSVLIVRRAWSQRQWALTVGVALNFTFITNDLVMAAQLVENLVPLSFLSYLVEVMILTLLTIQMRQRENLMLRDDVLEAGKAAEIGTMLAQVCHDIRNPLAVAQGFSRRARSLLSSNDSEGMVQCFDKIDSKLKRIEAIVKDYLGLMRNDSDSGSVPQPLHALVANSVDLCEAKFRRARVKDVVLEIDEDHWVSGFENRFVMIFMNLLSNAADAIEDLETRWIRIESKRVGSFLEVRVIDSGSGIPENVQQKLFEKKYTSKPKGEGTGLGLRFVKRIVESEGGTISIDNSCANTCFLVCIPSHQKEIEGLAQAS